MIYEKITGKFIVGIDFANDYTQVAIINDAFSEPESMNVVKGEQKLLIPTAMSYKKATNEWFVGDEALERAKNDSALLVDRIPSMLMEDDEYLFGEETITVDYILELFFKHLLSKIKETYSCDFIDSIGIAVEYPARSIINRIYDVWYKLGYPSGIVRVLSRSECFIYYVLSTQNQLWNNDVALFDFNENHFIYRRMSVVKNRTPMIITVNEYKMNSDISFDYLRDEAGKEKADTIFKEFIDLEFRKHLVSSAYLTGTGFYTEWAKKSIQLLCSKRRAFIGHNLYVRGACYGATIRFMENVFDGYMLYCTGRTKVDISLFVQYNGKNKQLVMSRAGTNWYEAGAEITCIVDATSSFQLVISSPLTKITRNVVIDISQLPQRPNKTTKISIALAYKNEEEFTIAVKDMGFGEFFKSSDVIIKKNYDVSEYI